MGTRGAGRGVGAAGLTTISSQRRLERRVGLTHPASHQLHTRLLSETVERALEHIAAGDIYQVNLAQRFQVDPAPDAPWLYRSLRESSPAPFAAYVSFPGGAIASSSPERFFRVEGDRIETWPIKGTRPRGATREEDAALAAALRTSEKDRAGT
jgi:para-aminobenzoate synthetase component 1